jgi:excisionase family DNA binding protein
MRKKSLLKVKSNLLLCEHVAGMLGVSLDTVYNYIKAGKLKAIKYTARNFRIDQKDLDAFIKKHKTK